MSQIYRIKENAIEASPGGSSGTLNYSVGYGTPAGGNVSQNPDKFGARDLNKAPAHGENQDTGSMIEKLPNRLDKKRKSSSGAPIHPAEMSDQGSFEKSSPSGDPETPNTIPFGSGGQLPKSGRSVTDFPGHGDSDGEDYYPNGTSPGDASNDNQSEVPGKEDDTSKGGEYQNAVADKDANPNNREYDKDVDQIFKKKVTPTPDELMSALQYELNQMVKKDKYIAKATVLKNFKDDPKYYSRLNMLNIDDDKMKVDESLLNRAKEKTVYKTGKDQYVVFDCSKTPISQKYLNVQDANNLIKKGYKYMDLTTDPSNLNEENKTTFEKTKSVLDEMIAAKKKHMQKPAKNLKEVDNIFKDLWNKRQGFVNKN
jgi:hypothetical protein